MSILPDEEPRVAIGMMVVDDRTQVLVEEFEPADSSADLALRIITDPGETVFVGSLDTLRSAVVAMDTELNRYEAGQEDAQPTKDVFDSGEHRLHIEDVGLE